MTQNTLRALRRRLPSHPVLPRRAVLLVLLLLGGPISAPSVMRAAPAPLGVLEPAVAAALQQQGADTLVQSGNTTGPPASEPEPLTGEQAQADQEIRARLQALYDRIGSLRDVSVEVDAGIVRLRGRALSMEARQRAVELAEGTDGVVFVEDDLRVVTDLGERLEPALTRIQEYAMGAVAFLPLLLVAALILIASVVLGGWIARWDGPHLRFASSPFTRGLVRQFIRFTFGVGGLLVVLELLDATALVGAVLGAAGVLGLAVGFAFKDIVENHLAGVMLTLRQPFAPNDHILVGSHEGKVVRLTARETILMTLAGNHVRIPNAELYKSIMTNFTRNPRRRFEFLVAVGTGDDLVKAQEVGLTVLRGMTGVMDDPAPSAQVTELGDSWVTLQFFGWVDQREADFVRVRSEAIRLVKRALEDADVSMPSPEYAILLRGGATEAGDEAPEGVDVDAVVGVGDAEAPTPSRQVRPASPAAPRIPEREAEQQDVSVDRTLDEQIDEDRRTSDEGDLLTESSPDDAGPEGETGSA